MRTFGAVMAGLLIVTAVAVGGWQLTGSSSFDFDEGDK